MGNIPRNRILLSVQNGMITPADWSTDIVLMLLKLPVSQMAT